MKKLNIVPVLRVPTCSGHYDIQALEFDVVEVRLFYEEMSNVDGTSHLDEIGNLTMNIEDVDSIIQALTLVKSQLAPKRKTKRGSK